MTDELLKYVDLEDDSLRIYEICNGCKPKIKVYGKGKITEDEEAIVV